MPNPRTELRQVRGNAIKCFNLLVEHSCPKSAWITFCTRRIDACMTKIDGDRHNRGPLQKRLIHRGYKVLQLFLNIMNVDNILYYLMVVDCTPRIESSEARSGLQKINCPLRKAASRSSDNGSAQKMTNTSTHKTQTERD